MSTASATATSHQERTTARLRNLLIGASFAVVLLVPKLRRIRQSPGPWFAFRTILGASGVALVLLPLTLSTNWFAAPAGLCMFLASVLLGPARPDTTPADKARELGALVVVNGGEYQAANSVPLTVQLYVGAESISVLDGRFHQLLVIPVPLITAAVAARDGKTWILQLYWSDQISEFSYHGVFAEHLARVAEHTIVSVIPSPLPVPQRGRAASV